MFNHILIILGFYAFCTVRNVTSEQNRVVGGYEAPDGAFPYQVSLRLREKYHFCGGSIMNEKWILTAAHCLQGMTPDNITVVVGSNLLNAGGDRYAVENVMLHPNYNQLFHINDIGLIKVKSSINFNNKIKPIRPSNKGVKSGDMLTLTGWGLTVTDQTPNDKPPNALQAIKLKAISFLQCKLSFLGLLFSVVSTNHICTLNHEGEGACNGDSGGPLVLGDQQVGVVSWGIPCAKGKPDVFTKVTSYLDWIQEETKL